MLPLLAPVRPAEERSDCPELARAGGVLIDGSPSAYTAMGLFFEGASSAAAAYFLRSAR